ncbi:MAG TPA: DUF3090 domain-containing protein [Herpetosiphonaceae bacterium]|nr:DUF3090 domain-containing protein [Herpetosiphonaceae bacterium]
MAEFNYDLDPVDRITVGAVGQPGQRTFYLQARARREILSLVLEKEQVGALGNALEQLLENLAEKNPLLSTTEDLIAVSNMDLEEPVEEGFRIGQLGLGYDEGRDLLVIIAQEAGTGEEGEELETARFTFSRDQGRAMAHHGGELIARGRPRCPQCGEPMNPEGHLCVKKNGHRTE